MTTSFPHPLSLLCGYYVVQQTIRYSGSSQRWPSTRMLPITFSVQALPFRASLNSEYIRHSDWCQNSTQRYSSQDLLSEIQEPRRLWNSLTGSCGSCRTHRRCVDGGLVHELLTVSVWCSAENTTKTLGSCIDGNRDDESLERILEALWWNMWSWRCLILILWCHISSLGGLTHIV